VATVSEPRWLTPEERAAWVRFVAVLELLPRALDSQLVRDEKLTHFDYFVLAMLSESPGATMRMAALATTTNATPPRLSKVMDRLEAQGLVERQACPGDRRATNAVLTEQGWAKIRQAAPGHVETVRRYVIDPLEPEQLSQLTDIAQRMLDQLDPERKVANPLVLRQAQHNVETLP
jgi:DNA-binding MarR family transcriptional regulator